MIEELKKMKISDLVDIDVSRLTSDEVAYIERRLVKEANRRLSRLKKARKTASAKLTRKERKGFKSYKAPKGYKPKTAGSNKLIVPGTKKKPIDLRNKRVKNVTDIQTFLKKKTTRIRELNAQEQRYKKVISDTLGKDLNLSSRQMKRISRLMEKAKEIAGLDGTSKKMSGSPRLLAQQLINELNDEDSKGITIDFDLGDDDDFDY